MMREREKTVVVNASFLMIDSSLSPQSPAHRVWTMLIRMVCLYHWIAMPMRLAFLPYPTFTDRTALIMDLPTDILIVLHVIVSLNTAYRAEGRSSWETTRFRIFQESDFLLFLGAIPLDWLGYACGASNEASCWLRINKLFLYFSRSSPKKVLFSNGKSSRGKVVDLLLTMFFCLHMLGCIWYWLGRAWPYLDKGPSVSWLFVDTNFEDMTYDRQEHFAMRPTSSTAQRYLLSIYWVAATLTVNGQVGAMIPQNTAELLFTTIIMALNMTLLRWILGEVSSIVMSGDDKVVKARTDLETVTNFVSGKRFSHQLREEIKSHFAAINAGSSVDQDLLFAGLSHGLRVELASFISRKLLTGIKLFTDCSEHFLQDVCVLLREVSFVPEEIVNSAGEVCKEVWFVVSGAVQNVDGEEIISVIHKNEAVGIYAVLFDRRHFVYTAYATRQGAVCMRLSRDGLNEMLKKYPQDKEILMRNGFRAITTVKTASTIRSNKSSKSKKSGTSKVSGKSGKSKKSQNSGSTKKTSNTRDGAAEDPDPMEEGQEENGSNAESGKQSKDIKSHGRGGGSESGSDDARDSGATIDIIKKQRRTEKLTIMLQAASLGDIDRIKTMLNSGEVHINSIDMLNRTGMLSIPIHTTIHSNPVSYVCEFQHVFKVCESSPYRGILVFDTFFKYPSASCCSC